MGLDLDFIVGKKQRPLRRDYRIFSQLSSAFNEEDELPSQVLFPRDFPEGHPKHGMEDAYGKVQFLIAKEIRECLKIPVNANGDNHAIKAWIDSLPDEEEVILYWH